MDEDLTLDELEVNDEEEDVEEDEELSGEEEDDAASPADDKSSTPDIAAKLAELEKGNKGLLSALTAERRERQNISAQLDEFKDVLKAVVDQSAGKPEYDEALQKIEDKIEKISLDFDESGSPYISAEKLAAFESATVKALKTEIDQLKAVTSSMVQVKTEDEFLRKLLSENENYTPAYKTLNDAWLFLKDEAFDPDREARGLPKPVSVDEAIEMALGSDTLKATFAAKFPGVDLESLMEAKLLQKPRYLRKALNKVQVQTKSSHTPLDLGRPTPLGSASSFGGDNNESLLKRIAEMSPRDFNKLDAKTIEKIDKLMEKFG